MKPLLLASKAPTNMLPHASPDTLSPLLIILLVMLVLLLMAVPQVTLLVQAPRESVKYVRLASILTILELVLLVMPQQLHAIPKLVSPLLVLPEKLFLLQVMVLLLAFYAIPFRIAILVPKLLENALTVMLITT